LAARRVPHSSLPRVRGLILSPWRREWLLPGDDPWWYHPIMSVALMSLFRKSVPALLLCFLLLAGILLTSSVNGAPKVDDQEVASRFALQYLKEIKKTFSFAPENGISSDFIFVGSSSSKRGGYRIIVVRGSNPPRVIWDSYIIKDSYLSVKGWDEMKAEEDLEGGYVVTLRGCMPHNCADGKIGFAIYSSKMRKTFISHLTYADGAYAITYFPSGDIPFVYKEGLNRQMCNDPEIRNHRLPTIECPRPAPKMFPTIKLVIWYNSKFVPSPAEVVLSLHGKTFHVPVSSGVFEVPSFISDSKGREPVKFSVVINGDQISTSIGLGDFGDEELWELFLEDIALDYRFTPAIPKGSSAKSACVMDFEPKGAEGIEQFDAKCRTPIN
jgi:hypothetical protein